MAVKNSELMAQTCQNRQNTEHEIAELEQREQTVMVNMKQTLSQKQQAMEQLKSKSFALGSRFEPRNFSRQIVSSH